MISEPTEFSTDPHEITYPQSFWATIPPLRVVVVDIYNPVVRRYDLQGKGNQLMLNKKFTGRLQKGVAAEHEGAVMRPLPVWRWCFFHGGVICLLGSIGIMAIGASHAHQTTDYLEQAWIAIPFIRRGLLCSLFSLFLLGFGRGLSR